MTQRAKSGRAGALSQDTLAAFLRPYLEAWGNDELCWETGDPELDACHSASQLADLMASRLIGLLPREAEAAEDRS